MLAQAIIASTSALISAQSIQEKIISETASKSEYVERIKAEMSPSQRYLDIKKSLESELSKTN